MNRLSRAQEWLGRAEDVLLALLLGALIVGSCAQIALRNLFDAGPAWLGPLLRYLVLWIGMLGALAAARRAEHTNVDVLSRLLPPGGRRVTGALTATFTGVVCALIAVHGTRLCMMERAAGTSAFADLPAWWFEASIPLCFGGMALRYAYRAVTELLPPAPAES